MVDLGGERGFPRLLSTARGTLVSDQAPEDTAQAMLDAITSATLTHGIQLPARYSQIFYLCYGIVLPDICGASI